MTAREPVDLTGFATPGRGRGLLDVFRRRYLLRLLVRKGVSTRYRNSALGWGWSYVKPLTQYGIYYFIMGEILGRTRGLENFAVYLLSGIIIVNLFNEAFGNATKSIVDNKALVKKIYLPRELFTVSAVIVAFIHFLPQAAVLIIISTLMGWVPTILELAAILMGLIIVILLATGLGMIFGAVNVSFRDAENFVEIIKMLATWFSPVLYSYVLIVERLPEWMGTLYMLNPLTSAVELFHYGFWYGTTTISRPTPPELLLFSLIGLAFCFVLIILGQIVFRRFERTFAQDV